MGTELSPRARATPAEQQTPTLLSVPRKKRKRRGWGRRPFWKRRRKIKRRRPKLANFSRIFLFRTFTLWILTSHPTVQVNVKLTMWYIQHILNPSVVRNLTHEQLSSFTLNCWAMCSLRGVLPLTWSNQSQLYTTPASHQISDSMIGVVKLQFSVWDQERLSLPPFTAMSCEFGAIVWHQVLTFNITAKVLLILPLQLILLSIFQSTVNKRKMYTANVLLCTNRDFRCKLFWKIFIP